MAIDRKITAEAFRYKLYETQEDEKAGWSKYHALMYRIKSAALFYGADQTSVECADGNIALFQLIKAINAYHGKDAEAVLLELRDAHSTPATSQLNYKA
jgi:hypothetical protein